MKVEGITVEDVLQPDADEGEEEGEGVSDEEPPPSPAAAAGKPHHEEQQRRPPSALPQETLQELEEYQSVEERRDELKTAMAVAASQLMQDPEAHIKNLRMLVTLVGDKDTQVPHECLAAYFGPGAGFLTCSGSC